MQALSDALEASLRERVDVRLGHEVHTLERDGARVRVDGEAFDAVVLATSSAAAARLLAPLGGAHLDPRELRDLAAAETLSSVTVSLGYDAAQIAHPLDGTGFVVGDPFEGFRACTFTSS
jgi:oxygen-dependent protoporphyrinogen oxidase